MSTSSEIVKKVDEEVLERKSQELEKVTKRLNKFAKYTGATFEVIREETDIENSDRGCIVCPPNT